MKILHDQGIHYMLTLCEQRHEKMYLRGNCKEQRCRFCLNWGLTTRQPLWVILCRLPEQGRREIEEIVEEVKKRDRGERKMNESEGTEEKKFPPLPLPAASTAGLVQLSQYQLDAPVT